MEIIIFAVITALIYITGDLILINAPRMKLSIFLEAGVGAVIKRSSIVGIINIAAITLCQLFVSNFTITEVGISAIAVLTAAIFCFLSFVASRYLNGEKARGVLKRLALLVIIPLLLEIFLFNAKSINPNKQQLVPDLPSFTTTAPTAVKIGSEAITFSAAGSADISLERSDISAVKINFSGSGIFKCRGEMTDENSTTVPRFIGEKQTSADYGCTLVFSPYKTLHSFRISLPEVKSPISITGVEFFSAAPFEFSLLRFLIISAAALIIYLIYKLKLYKVIYDRKKLAHKVVIFAALALCLFSVFAFMTPNDHAISYKNTSIPESDQYIQTFDAIYNGRANLDIPVSSSLAAMDNPYDSLLRSQNNVSFSWDRAYYNGKYYSYFGVVPVLVFYFPYYLISDKLPTLSMASTFFSFLSIIFLFGTVMTAVKKFIKRPNMLLLVLGLITAVAAGGIYYSLDFPSVYFNAVISSLSFLLLCLWTGLAAYKQGSAKKQLALLLASGLSFILCVGCRPTMALNALILAPVFIYFLMRRDYSLSRKISCACSFLLPVIIGAAALMWYNYIRFDSPFAFGSSYQLTVSNMQANAVSLRELPSAFIQYFLQPPEFSSAFPHISLSAVALSNYGHYVYCDVPLSLINFPSIILALALLPLVLKNHRRSAKRLGTESNIKFYTYLLIVALSVIIIWLDFCMAGAAIRYLLDILPTLALLSILVFLECNQNFASTPSLQHKGTLLFSVSMVATSAMVFLHLLTLTGQALFAKFPNILFEAQKLMEFWC